MADPEDTKPEDAQGAPEDHHHAPPHHNDKGTIVETAFGEKMSGGVADIADGDDE